MIAFLLVFIVYQLYRLVLSPTFGLTVLTIFDALIVWLTWREWRRQTPAVRTTFGTESHPWPVPNEDARLDDLGRLGDLGSGLVLRVHASLRRLQARFVRRQWRVRNRQPTGQSPIPASRAFTMASGRDAAWILAKMLVMWLPTVLGATVSRAAMVVLSSPDAIRSRTSRSRAVSLGKAGSLVGPDR